MDEKLNKALEAYESHFNDGFPMFAMSAKPINEVIQIIDECIQENKDVYDLGYLKEDVIYYVVITWVNGMV